MRLLLLETHHLGDAVLSVPFVRGALQAHEILIVCRPSQAAIYQCVNEPGLRVETWEPPWMSHESSKTNSIADFRRIVGPWRPEIAVSCWPDLRVHLLLLLSGAPLRVGFPMNERNLIAMHLKWRQKRLAVPAAIDRLLAGWLMTQRLDRSPADPQQTSLWRIVAEGLHVSHKSETPWFRGDPVSPDLQAWIEEMRRQGRPIWLLHGGARTPMKRWSADYFQEIARRLTKTFRAAVLGVELPDGGTDYRVIQPASIAEFFGILSQVAQVLSNDSFPAHAAAAMGIPVWTIFSSQDPAKFAPLNNEERAIDAAICPFRPCLDRCLRPSYECIEAVTVDLVWRRIAEGSA